MNSAMRKGWRNSASLILLNKRLGDVQKGATDARAVNYDVLLQTRPSSGTFPNCVVFPGGVSEAADGGDRWIHLFKSHGYRDEDFGVFHQAGTSTTSLFQPNPIQRHVQLRITAIRETFEELGLLICSTEQKNQRLGLWASSLLGVDVKFWQDRIAKDPAEFFHLCTATGCYPDIWSLYYWSNWLSPTNVPKRFDTAFFLATLETRPEITSNQEVAKVEWSSPLDVIERNIKKEIELFPPQRYELTRLLHIPDVKQLAEFARQRSGYCDDLTYPVSVKAKDGFFWVYPGDDLYPLNVDYYTDAINLKHKSLAELNKDCETIHRFQKSYSDPETWVLLTKNLKQNNHIVMGENPLVFPKVN